MSLFFSKIFTIGIDLSDYSVKVVQAKKKNKKHTIVSVGAEKIPNGIIKEGIIEKDKEVELVKIVNSAISKVKGKKIKTKNAICSLPEEKAFIKVVKIPKNTSKDEMNDVVKWQIESNFPVELDMVYYEWELVPQKENKKDFLEVCLAVIPKEIVDSYFSFFKLAGINPIAFEIESMPIVRSLISNYFSKDPIIVLDIGKTGTSLTVFLRETILFTSHINISGSDFDNAISKELKVSSSEAEKIKKRVGLLSMKKIRKVSRKEFLSSPELKIYRVPVVEDKNINRKKIIEREGLIGTTKADRIFNSIVPILNDFTGKIGKHIDYLKEFEKGSDITVNKAPRIILCGGGANLLGIDDFLSNSLKLPVEVGNPLVNVSFSSKIFGENLKEKSLAFSTAIGLAIKEQKKCENQKI